MASIDHLDTPAGQRIAYRKTEGTGPLVVFLGGFKSDMEGTKAVHLEAWAQAKGRGFLRLDYSGHGSSSGDFEDGSIGDWCDDALAVIDTATEGPLVLVGSSMGGWIACLIAKARPDRLAGFVGIAAAPDFTEDSMWASFDEEQKSALERDGRVELPSDYSDEPYVITKRLIDEGRKTLVLRDPLAMACPVRLLQGTEDEDVEMSVALHLLDHIDAADLRLTLVKGADHRFSSPECLAMIEQAIEEVT